MKIFVSTVEFVSLFFLAFSIFRIPFKYDLLKISTLSLLIAGTSHIQRDLLGLEPYSVITSILMFIVFVFFLWGMPLLYATLVCITGYATFAFLQTILAFVSIEVLHLTTAESIQNQLQSSIYQQSISIIVVLLIVLWMQKRKLGFMFIVNRFVIKDAFKGINLFLSLIMVASIILMQAILTFFRNSTLLLWFILILGILLTVFLVVIYRKNMKELWEKYERFNKK